MGKRRGNRSTSTTIRKEFDRAALRKAVEGEGVDLREWSSYGVVGTLDEEGNLLTSDDNIYVAPAGVTVDVVLLPSGVPVPCRYAGIAGGEDTLIFAPIEPGAEVRVSIPSGDLREPPVIESVLHNQFQKMPLGDDKKPRWKNDRVLVFHGTKPIELRQGSGSVVRLEADGEISMVPGGGKSVKAGSANDGDLEAAGLGDSTQGHLDALKIAFDIHTHVVPNPSSLGTPPAVASAPPVPQSPDVPDVTSSNVKVKK